MLQLARSDLNTNQEQKKVRNHTYSVLLIGEFNIHISEAHRLVR